MTRKLVDGNSVVDDANEVYTYDGLNRMLTADKDINDVTVKQERTK